MAAEYMSRINFNTDNNEIPYHILLMVIKILQVMNIQVVEP